MTDTLPPTTPQETELIERQAEAILRQLDQQNTLDNAPTPQNTAMIRELVMSLHGVLARHPTTNDPDNPMATLTYQAEILDHAFRRLIHDADTTYAATDRVDCDPMKYAAAFKAQDQYRRTVKTLTDLKAAKARKRREKSGKTRGKRT